MSGPKPTANSLSDADNLVDLVGSDPVPLTDAEIADTLLRHLGQPIEPVWDHEGEEIISFMPAEKRGRGRPRKPHSAFARTLAAEGVSKVDHKALSFLQEDARLHQAGTTNPQARADKLGYRTLEGYKKARSRALARFPAFRRDQRGDKTTRKMRFILS